MRVGVAGRPAQLLVGAGGAVACRMGGKARKVGGWGLGEWC